MDPLLAEGGDPKEVDPLLAQEKPLMGGDPSLPLCMRYQRSRGSALGRGPLDPLWEGTPYALVCFYSGGDSSWEGTPYLSV